MSGLPGSVVGCRRYRYPRACNAFLRRNSGVVSFPRTADMHRLRCSGVSTSILGELVSLTTPDGDQVPPQRFRELDWHGITYLTRDMLVIAVEHVRVPKCL